MKDSEAAHHFCFLLKRWAASLGKGKIDFPLLFPLPFHSEKVEGSGVKFVTFL